MPAASHPGQRGFPGVLFQAPLLLPQAALMSEGGTDPGSHHPAPGKAAKQEHGSVPCLICHLRVLSSQFHAE